MKLIRTDTSDQGTFGILVFGDAYIRTIELPWRDNQPRISCIPTGKYPVRMRISPKYGKCFEVTRVSGRSYILFHHGNFAGSRADGYRSNSAGCILTGTNRGRIYGQKAVLGSRIARTRLETAINWEDFKLEVINA